MQFSKVMLSVSLLLEAVLVGTLATGFKSDSIILNSFQKKRGEGVNPGISSQHPNNALTKEGKKLLNDVGYPIYKRSPSPASLRTEEDQEEVQDRIPEDIRQGRERREVKATGSDFGAGLWETLTHHSWTYLLGGVSVICLIIAIVMLLQGNGTEATELKSVQIIFRHGERPTETTWPPTSQLTEEGKKQMFDLGQFIRKRYPHILRSEFKPSEIFLISSDVERTIMSANLVAYGIYKAFSVSSHWSKGNTIPYEPIPVKTLLRENDIYLNHNFKCPRMLQLFSSSVQAFLENLSGADENIKKIVKDITGKSGNTSVPINSGFDDLQGFLQEALLISFN
ncbi:unnamed protein product [Allacma fusca]|uniref:Uncharacterized protein n=1 Tax=Allacma fusca TaxID=39272 RepID=A0A8J2JVC3_9HEXA|nr:unnamed protein product [Allacma fusca]